MHINRHLERMHKEKIKLEMSNGIQVVTIKDESQNLNSTVWNSHMKYEDKTKMPNLIIETSNSTQFRLFHALCAIQSHEVESKCTTNFHLHL